MAAPMKRLLDLDRYPLHAPASAAGRALVENCRAAHSALRRFETVNQTICAD